MSHGRVERTARLVRYWASIYTDPDMVRQWAFTEARDTTEGSSFSDDLPLIILREAAEDLGLRAGLLNLDELVQVVHNRLVLMSIRAGGLSELVDLYQWRARWVRFAENMANVVYDHETPKVPVRSS